MTAEVLRSGAEEYGHGMVRDGDLTATSNSLMGSQMQIQSWTRMVLVVAKRPKK